VRGFLSHPGRGALRPRHRYRRGIAPAGRPPSRVRQLPARRPDGGDAPGEPFAGLLAGDAARQPTRSALAGATARAHECTRRPRRSARVVALERALASRGAERADRGVHRSGSLSAGDPAHLAARREQDDRGDGVSTGAIVAPPTGLTLGFVVEDNNNWWFLKEVLAAMSRR